MFSTMPKTFTPTFSNIETERRTSASATACGVETRMHRSIAETYARSPSYYGATWCIACCKHLPVSQFVWVADNQAVGS